MQKRYSFGGELYDQGVHIIDLANWFMGDFNKVFAQNRNFFWKKSDLEDNSFCQLFTKSGQVAYFQVSLTQWRNKFLFEIFGSKGFLIINGLGNSYGVETLTLGTEVGQGKTPIEEVFKLEGPDISWREEWVEFKNSIVEKRQPLANAEDNVIINKILQGLYKSAKKSKIIKI
jgi:predicted dehydrogenase